MGTVKVMLVCFSLVMLGSMGGGFVVLPLLTPAYVWAARRSRLGGRIGWCVLVGLAAGEVGWLVTYLSMREAKPWIWLIPLASAFAAGGALFRFSRR